MIISNIVTKENMRKVQSETLLELKNALMQSFGPMGSNTIIAENGRLTQYSKDGHTILSKIHFPYAIEATVKQDLEDITRHVVKNIGDGTTSSVILSQILFEKLKEKEIGKRPYFLIKEFKDAVKVIKEEIETRKQEFTSQTAYDITYISTNGNEEVSNIVKDIYEKYGKDVFIDVSTSNTTESYLKTYDGMTLETGYSDVAYINDKAKGVCTIRSPKVYQFEDPIDTTEMMSLFNAILEQNIMNGYMTNNIDAVVPTVILAPTLSRDMSSYMSKLIEFMYQFKDETTKPPFLLITNIYNRDQFVDISRMCGCKPIKKYINKDQQDADIERGLAATPQTVCSFAGSADIVESDLNKTKFVNPKLMHDENGELSIEFINLVDFLESELAKAYEEAADANVTGTLKRRINSLKANMVEYLVGGVSASDRDSLRDLVEDSVLNCRNAARYGVGYGANFEAFRAAEKHKEKGEMFELIYDAYKELVETLYATAIVDKEEVKLRVKESLEKNMPINLRSFEFDGKVLCSITTDMVVLDAISQIITLMFTSNQFLTPNAAENKYLK